jgi:hypothetical protein
MKDFKETYDRKGNEVTAAQRQKNEETATQHQATKNAIQQARKALKDIVLPYLRRVASQIPMQIEESMTTDGKIVGIDFRIEDCPRYAIEALGSVFRLARLHDTGPASIALEHVYVRDERPFIADPAKLTEQNLDDLIDMIIDQRRTKKQPNA